MGSSNSTLEDNQHNDQNLVHSGSELNIGFVNVHTETVNHGIKLISILLGLLLIAILVCKCKPLVKYIYKKCFKKPRNRFMEYQHYLAQNNMQMHVLQGDLKHHINPRVLELNHVPMTVMIDKSCQTEHFRNIRESLV